MKSLLLVIGIFFAIASHGAPWPSRISAPYLYVGSGDQLQPTQCDDACGQKYYTIAFIITNPKGFPAWDGRFSPEKNFYRKQIDALRKRGGDVIVSFGGEGGTELAIAETNAITLETKYQSLIDRYQLTWLDFDIEGDALGKTSANERRNQVLAALQKKNPGLRITFTLPVDPEGIPKDARRLLVNARTQGVNVYSANVMTMDYGEEFSKGKTMSSVSIASVLKAHEQCHAIDPSIQIGVTAMIGQNDQPTEMFSQADAVELVQWAKAQSWICSVSFWSSDRDRGLLKHAKNTNLTSGVSQTPWEFTRIFQSFMN